jgi:hypothetical protein
LYLRVDNKTKEMLDECTDMLKTTRSEIVRRGVLSNSEQKFLAALDGELKEMFDQYSDAQAEISLLSDVDRFVYGYRLGMLDSLIAGES